MRIHQSFILIILIVAVGGFFYYANLPNNNVFVQSTAGTGSAKVLYCQEARCDREVIQQITDAQKFVYFSVYTITRPDIVNALIGAKLRGLEVKGVTDFNQSLIAEEKPELSRMKKAGIQIEAPYKQDGLMHIKMLVTDVGYVSGSYNWTTAATTYNDEVIETGNIEYIRSSYLQIFKRIWEKYKNSIL